MVASWRPNSRGRSPPAGSYVRFKTHLGGVKADGSAIDLGPLGFDWLTTYNGRVGGVVVLKTRTPTPADPGTGTGGVTVVDVKEVTDYQFNGIGVTTVNGTPVGAPQISAVQATNVTNVSATIVWTTDKPADTQLDFGLTSAYGTTTPLDPALTTSHSVQLTGLRGNTTYHVQVRSTASGNTATGSDFTFTTLPSSLVLNSAASYAEVPSANDLNITGDWTVEAWFKDEDPNGFNHDFRQILMKGDRNATAEAPYYVLVGRNSILAGVRTGGQDYPIVWDMHYLGLDPKLWHHVAVTFRADINVLNLWLDGKHIAYLTVPAHSAVGNTLPLEIGRSGPTTGKYWIGKLDDVRIWNVARKATDITATYTTQLNGPQSGLVANWHFDEGSGTTAADSSGNHHDATLNGGATFSTDVHP